MCRWKARALYYLTSGAVATIIVATIGSWSPTGGVIIGVSAAVFAGWRCEQILDRLMR
jgi:hypothetical protein